MSPTEGSTVHSVAFEEVEGRYGAFQPQEDCCEEFKDIFDGSVSIDVENNEVMVRIDYFDIDMIPITMRYCPFCGARFIVKE